MARTLSAAMLAGIQQKDLYPIVLISCQFDSGPLNLWTGVGTLVVEGIPYIGTGILLSISNASESQDMSATNLSITLSGLPLDVISLAYNENYQERSCSMSLGLMRRTTTGYHRRESGGYALLEDPGITIFELREDGGIAQREDGGTSLRQEVVGGVTGAKRILEFREGNLTLVYTPYEFFTGFMDTMTIEENSDSTTIVLSVEHELVDGDRPIIRKWAPEDHKIDYPDDTGFDWMAGLAQREIVWKG